MQNNQPLVSIVIPCYNHGQFVQDSIQSVIDQTYENIELIILDDGSRDNSVTKIEEMIKTCEQRFVRFEFRSRDNVGLSQTLNEALEWCEGEYLSPIASDDILLPHKTELQVGYMKENTKIAAVFGGIILVDQNNKEISRAIGTNKLYNFKNIIMHNYKISTPTAMIRIEVARNLGGYDQSLFIEDWYMWLKISEHGKIFVMENILALYRQHTENSSKNFDKMHEGRIEVLKKFQHSPYYKKALKKTLWLNQVEIFLIEKQFLNYVKLLVMNPKETTFLSLKHIDKKLFNKLK